MTTRRDSERGHTNPFLVLAIFVVLGLFVYLAIDAKEPGEQWPTLSDLAATWWSWPWWGKVLSIIGPLGAFRLGASLDRASGFYKFPSDPESPPPSDEED